MIVQDLDGKSLAIAQPDHAALAGRIMEHWAHGGLPSHPRRPSILLAVGEHDNGWREVDAWPPLDPATGRLLDFMTVAADVRRGVSPRGVDRLSGDPWAAALVAQHAIHVYRRFRDDRQWDGFFREMEAARDRLVARAAGLDLQQLLADYFFVRMGDLLSLTFCNAWSEAPDELGYAIRGEGARLTVMPDPFDGREIPIAVPARTCRRPSRPRRRPRASSPPPPWSSTPAPFAAAPERRVG